MEDLEDKVDNLCRQGKWAEALAEQEKLLNNLSETDPEELVTLGMILNKLGRHSGAERILKPVVDSTAPTMIEAYEVLFDAYSAQGTYRKLSAEKLLGSMMQKNPFNQEAELLYREKLGKEPPKAY